MPGGGHSLIVRCDNLPDQLEKTAWTDDGIIMGLKHKKYPILWPAIPPRIDHDRAWSRHAKKLLGGVNIYPVTLYIVSRDKRAKRLLKVYFAIVLYQCRYTQDTLHPFQAGLKYTEFDGH